MFLTCVRCLSLKSCTDQMFQARKRGYALPVVSSTLDVSTATLPSHAPLETLNSRRVPTCLLSNRSLPHFLTSPSMTLPTMMSLSCSHATVWIDLLFRNFDIDPLADTCYSGIWDCQSSQAVVEFVRRGIASKQELTAICENMMDNCLASNSETGGVGCDNMTITIVAILNGKSKEEWYQMIADRVAQGDGPCAPPEYGQS